jgi:hypothetical protein
VFSTFVNFKAFFDEFFVAKSRFGLLKLLVEFNDVSKTGLESKTLSGDIGIFLGQGTVSKILISVYLVPEKCQYLRSGCTDFRFKISFRNVIKFY